jgi:hypothetical protein
MKLEAALMFDMVDYFRCKNVLGWCRSAVNCFREEFRGFIVVLGGDYSPYVVYACVAPKFMIIVYAIDSFRSKYLI